MAGELNQRPFYRVTCNRYGFEFEFDVKSLFESRDVLELPVSYLAESTSVDFVRAG